jgi:hypothetical protein
MLVSCVEGDAGHGITIERSIKRSQLFSSAGILAVETCCGGMRDLAANDALRG